MRGKKLLITHYYLSKLTEIILHAENSEYLQYLFNWGWNKKVIAFNKALPMHLCVCVCVVFFFFQDYKFENPFYEPPSVLASARHDNVTSALWMKADGRFSNALNVWIEVSNFVDCIQSAISFFFGLSRGLF